MSDLTLVSGSYFDNFLLPNYGKFAVESDWNIKISQNVKNLGFLG